MSVRLGRALARWQKGAGSYWPYVCAAPFLARRMPRAPRSAADTATGRLSIPDRWRMREGIAMFFDLPPAIVLTLTEGLIRIGIFVVPVIQRWPEPSAVLPTAELLRALVAGSQLAECPSQPRGVAFILDGERDGRRLASDPASPPLNLSRFDNRYHYTADRFPSPELLQKNGVCDVEWISEDGPAADLQSYALGLAEAGLRPSMVEPASVATR